MHGAFQILGRLLFYYRYLLLITVRLRVFFLNEFDFKGDILWSSLTGVNDLEVGCSHKYNVLKWTLALYLGFDFLWLK